MDELKRLQNNLNLLEDMIGRLSLVMREVRCVATR